MPVAFPDDMGFEDQDSMLSVPVCIGPVSFVRDEVNWKQELQNFVDISPKPHGWTRWQLVIARAEGALSRPGADFRDILMQVLALANQPRSYKRWNAAQNRLLEMLGSVYCICCSEVFPVESLHRRQSGVGISDIAGLVCPDCRKEIEAGKHIYPKYPLPITRFNYWDNLRLEKGESVIWEDYQNGPWVKCSCGCDEPIYPDGPDDIIIDEGFGYFRAEHYAGPG